jgi:hypothetical protein
MGMVNHGGMISAGKAHDSSSSHLVENQEELGEENDAFRFRSMFVHTLK